LAASDPVKYLAGRRGKKKFCSSPEFYPSVSFGLIDLPPPGW
jgi:hypothetical protein